jgi:hypothetical protein
MTSRQARQQQERREQRWAALRDLGERDPQIAKIDDALRPARDMILAGFKEAIRAAKAHDIPAERVVWLVLTAAAQTCCNSLCPPGPDNDDRLIGDFAYTVTAFRKMQTLWHTEGEA